MVKVRQRSIPQQGRAAEEFAAKAKQPEMPRRRIVLPVRPSPIRICRRALAAAEREAAAFELDYAKLSLQEAITVALAPRGGSKGHHRRDRPGAGGSAPTRWGSGGTCTNTLGKNLSADPQGFCGGRCARRRVVSFPWVAGLFSGFYCRRR